MTEHPPGARLIGRGGAVAGSRFEVQAEATIGLGQDGRVVIGSGPAPTPLARIYFNEGRYFLENRSETQELLLDGAPVEGHAPLDRLHVIELPEGVELVFNRAPSASRTSSQEKKPEEPAPPEPAEKESSTADPPAAEPGKSDTAEPSAGDDPGRTVLDMGAFGALPELPDEGESQDEGKQPSSSRDTPEKEGEPPAEDDPGQTVLDMGAFTALPELSESEEDEETPAGSPPESEDDPGRTVLDMAGFGALPELDDGQDEPEESAPEAEEASPEPESGAGETVEAPRQPTPARFQITADIPGKGLRSFELKSGDNTVGRGEDCDITVFDPERWLSRKHAVIRVQPDGVEIIDLKGVNGTFVGGERIEQAELTPGSTFLLGPHLEFTLKER